MMEIKVKLYREMVYEIESLKLTQLEATEEIRLLKHRLLKAESENHSAVGVNKALKWKLDHRFDIVEGLNG